MKKTYIKNLLAFALTLPLSVALAGCESHSLEDTEPINDAVVATQGRNMPVADFSGTEDELLNIAETDNGSAFTLIISDGDPYVAASLTCDDLTGKNAAHRKEKVKKAVETLNEASAQSNETDLITAIDMAARQLHSVNETGTLYVFHSGLSTAGVLQIQRTNDLTELDIEALAEQLSDEFDLTGIDMVWYYLGDVCGNQPELSKDERKTLEQLWSTLLTKNNAASVTFKEDLPTSGELENAPPISVVESHVTEEALPTLTTPVSLDESILFDPNNAVLKDEEAAKSALAPIAEKIKANGISILIAGSCVQTSDSTPESAKAFTEQRANAVAALMIELSIDPAKIQIVGLGYQDTPLRSDIDNENRVVYILNADSELASQLLLTE